MLICGAIMSCGSTSQEEINPLRSQLMAQIEASCQAATSYEKRIQDQSQSDATSEDSLYAPIPMVRVGENQAGEDSLGYLLLEDLSYAFRAFYSDAASADKYDITQRGDILIATLKPAYASQTELQSQSIVSSNDSELIRYFENQILTESWLYDVDIDLRIWFDEEGLYQRHRLEVETNVPLIDASFHALIRGQHLYP